MSSVLNTSYFGVLQGSSNVSISGGNFNYIQEREHSVASQGGMYSITYSAEDPFAADPLLIDLIHAQDGSVYSMASTLTRFIIQ